MPLVASLHTRCCARWDVPVVSLPVCAGSVGVTTLKCSLLVDASFRGSAPIRGRGCPLCQLVVRTLAQL